MDITSSLRNEAANWSLAGDKKLLEVLQNIHQNIMTKCQETNRQLETMVTSLNDANVCLQNVNNKFMALSSSQFVESRVYDDDADIVIPAKKEATTNEELPKHTDAESDEISKLKQSLEILEKMHEEVHIVDDDDDSIPGDGDYDDEIQLVLKPKDIYKDRPLPHIIGSYQWKSKWHAGLLPDESDTDSSISKQDVKEMDQYSESEPEVEENRQTDMHSATEEEESSSTEATDSEMLQTSKPTPAAVAAELARRLGGGIPPPPPPSAPEFQETNAAKPPERKIYRPEKPLQGRVFSDEPPPLDNCPPDDDDDELDNSWNDDIFAELYAGKPSKDKAQVHASDELFSGLGGGSSDLTEAPEDGAPNYQDITSSLGRSYTGVEPRASRDTRTHQVRAENASANTAAPVTNERSDMTRAEMKKLVGGVSIFGSNQESIGAAILKRNIQKSSSSEDDSKNNDLSASSNKITKTQAVKVKQTNEQPATISVVSKKQEDEKFVSSDIKPQNILEDLFKKPEKVAKKTVTQKFERDVIQPMPKENKVDLFNDNLFDDIDDIFSSNTVSNLTSKETNMSIFDDDDDDDLFANISISKPVKNNVITKRNINVESVESIISNNDDELFNKPSDASIKKETNDELVSPDIKMKIEHKNLSNVKNSPTVECFSESESFSNVYNKEDKKNIFTKKSFIEYNQSIVSNESQRPQKSERLSQETYLFDDDSDEDLFSTIIKTENRIQKVKETMSDTESNTNRCKQNIRNDTLTESNLDSEFPNNDNLETKNETSISEPTVKKHLSIHDNDGTNNFVIKTSGTRDVESEGRSMKVEITDDNVINTKSDNPSCNDDISNSFEATQTNNTLIPSLESEESCKVDDVENISSTLISSDTEELGSNEYKAMGANNTLVYPEVSGIENYEKRINAETGKTENIKYLDTNRYLEEAIFSEINTSKTDLFNEIFSDQPPAFEKPKEPKKSKNVNALFDDDSDDEALFFKKSDTIDENIDNSSSDKNRFTIFRDEPPDLDIDFNKPKHCIEQHESEHLIPKGSHDASEQAKSQLITTQTISNTASSTNSNSEIREHNNGFNDNLSIRDELTRSIGKLKPMNLNINVNSLLPVGSSTIVANLKDRTDGQIMSFKTESYSQLEKEPNTDIKSVSFEGDPASKVLDNKVSKERVKIKVKRRPSTRKARHEAIRKSAIEDASESTDDSNSVNNFSSTIVKEHMQDSQNVSDRTAKTLQDTNAKIIAENVTETFPTEKYTKEKSVVIQSQKLGSDNVSSSESNKSIEPSETSSILDEKSTVTSKTVYILNDEDIFNVEPTINIQETMEQNSKKNIAKEVSSKEIERQPPTFLYEDDEILFRNTDIRSVDNITENVIKQGSSTDSVMNKRVLTVIDNDRNIFIEPSETLNTQETLGVKTLGKVYENKSKTETLKDNNEDEIFGNKQISKEVLMSTPTENFEATSYSKCVEKNTREVTTTNKSVFHISDDEVELFGGDNKPVGNKITTDNIFGDESDDELFTNKKTSIKNVKKEVKKSLFDDDDDLDDDVLFGGTSRK